LACQAKAGHLPFSPPQSIKKIDALVYGLYGITEEGKKVIEGGPNKK
jgi:hypothetical protein